MGSLELPRAALRRGEAKVRGFQGLVLGCLQILEAQVVVVVVVVAAGAGSGGVLIHS